MTTPDHNADNLALQKRIGELEAQLAKRNERIDRLQLDEARLDWIERIQPTLSVAQAFRGSPGGPHVYAGDNSEDDRNHFYGSNFRAAIDNAMKAKP